MHWSSYVLDYDDVITILFWSKETRQRGFPLLSKVAWASLSQQSESEENEKEEKEKDEEDGDNTASDNDSRFGASGVSHIGVSLSSSTGDDNESSRHNSITASNQIFFHQFF